MPSDNPDEIFDLVTLDDEVFGIVRRGDAHRDPALIHRSVQTLVFASDGRILFQRRAASKDLYPGYFCASASGHVMRGDEYERTARREIEEELGVALEVVHVSKAVVRSVEETEVTALFLARSDGPFHFSPTETNGGVFLSLEEALARRGDPAFPLTPAALVALDEVVRLRAAGGLEAALERLPAL